MQQYISLRDDLFARRGASTIHVFSRSIPSLYQSARDVPSYSYHMVFQRHPLNYLAGSVASVQTARSILMVRMLEQ